VIGPAAANGRWGLQNVIRSGDRGAYGLSYGPLADRATDLWRLSCVWKQEEWGVDPAKSDADLEAMKLRPQRIGVVESLPTCPADVTLIPTRQAGLAQVRMAIKAAGHDVVDLAPDVLRAFDKKGEAERLVGNFIYLFAIGIAEGVLGAAKIPTKDGGALGLPRRDQMDSFSWLMFHLGKAFLELPDKGAGMRQQVLAEFDQVKAHTDAVQKEYGLDHLLSVTYKGEVPLLGSFSLDAVEADIWQAIEANDVAAMHGLLVKLYMQEFREMDTPWVNMQDDKIPSIAFPGPADAYGLPQPFRLMGLNGQSSDAIRELMRTAMSISSK
jgi:hypothetical protein